MQIAGARSYRGHRGVLRQFSVPGSQFSVKSHILVDEEPGIENYL
jgi:hypothetical protein